MTRIGSIERATKESRVAVSIDLDGTGTTEISTGVGFYDHMLDQLGRHGCFDLRVKTEGDLHIDAHHTVEDTAIALGQAFARALGDKQGIRRFADVQVPLDEALVSAVVDVSGRPYLVHTEPDVMSQITINGNFAGSLVRHIWESFVHHAAIAAHIEVKCGRDPHHIAEAQFKAMARALRTATEPDPRVTGIPSTKGLL